MLHQLYYDTESPAHFANSKTLYYHARLLDPTIKFKNVTAFLEAQRVYTLHKQTPIRKFQRNKVIATGLDTHWQADLCDMRALKASNNNNGYILTVVDVLSKYGFAECVVRKSSELVAEAFAKIVKRSKRCPWYLMVDKGSEFRGEFLRYVTKDLGIILHTANTPIIKAPNVERFNRIVKTRMWKIFSARKSRRYTKILQQIINGCNERFSRPIQMRPSQVTYMNEEEVRQRLYGDQLYMKTVQFKYKLGDRVRIVNTQKTFQKGYHARFSKKPYVITECLPRQPPVYRVRKEDSQQSLNRIFYHEELVKIV